MLYRLLIPAMLATAVMSAPAQTTETPVAFDSTGRILSVSRSLATRLNLSAPTWPVSGEFVEARVYRVSSGGYVMTVSRIGGAVERYPLTDAEFAGLRTGVQTALEREGRVVSEDAATVISEPARGPFVRDQMLLASIIYGPSLSTLTGDASAGAGVYLLTVGGTFFALNNFARQRIITKAQNALTTDGAFRGWSASALTIGALGADSLSEDAVAITALIGGIGGSILGYQRGKRLTHGEAQAAMTGSTLLAAGTLGLGFMGGLVKEGDGQAASAAVLAGGIAGYVLGPKYPRNAPYTVTAGDVGVVRLGAFLGSLAAITPFVDSDIDGKAAAGILTAGLAGGAIVADRIGAKPFNHSISDSRMIYLGALGGALMGVALPVMTQSDNATFVMTMVTGGAIAGSFVTQNIMKPSREGSAAFTPSGNSSNRASSRIEFSPEGLALAAAKQRGMHSVLRVRV
ncbi:MAG TPA: hypothetical protein VFO55_14805 [Gemmatimonadaceae bacterium]|nr:hypothetical protein [Gemmatimonadaceae bacterium]